MPRRCYIIVRQVTPQSGLLEGGSVLTIEGTNLGYQEGQVSVTVVDVPCHITEYTVSTRSETAQYTYV